MSLFVNQAFVSPELIQFLIPLILGAMHLIMSSAKDENDKKKRITILPESDLNNRFEFHTKEDEFFYLLLLSTHFIEINNEGLSNWSNRSKELAYIEKYFKKYFEPQLTNKLMSLLKKQLKNIEVIYKGQKNNGVNVLDKHIIEPTLEAKRNMDYETKLQVLNFINGLCFADGQLDLSEELGLERWSQEIGIAKKDYDKFRYARWKKRDNSNPLFKKYSEIDNKEIAISDYIFWKKITRNSSSINKLRNSLEEKEKHQVSKEKERKARIAQKQKETLEKNKRAKIMLENTGLADELTKEEKDAFFKLSEDLQLEYIKKLEEQVFASTDFIKLPAIQRHLSELDEELKAFTDIISKKLNPTDKRYIKYQDTVEKAYFMAIENINKLYQKIGKKKFGILLSEMPDNLDSILDIKKETIGTKKENKLSEFEEAVEDIKSVIETNSIAMDNIEELTMEVASLDNKDIEHSKVIEEAIKELDEWTDKVNLYK